MNFWIIWVLALLFKIVLLPFIPITPDEAYYFVWGRHLQLSYFDHPPFVAYIMTIAQFFWETPFTARLPGVLLSHCSLIPWFYILKKLEFNNNQIIFWLLLILFSPLVGIGSFIVTPDAPFLFFWSLSVLAFLNLIENTSLLKNWLVIGALIGFGMLSKYMMVIFVIALFFWFIYQKDFKVFISLKSWAAVLVSILIFLPVIIWNFKNNFASFGFQANHGLAGAKINFFWPLEYVAGQWALLNPILATFLITQTKNLSKNLKPMVFISMAPLLFFLLTSFRSHVEPNWPVAAHPGIIALAVSAANTKRHQKILKSALFLSLVFFVLVITHAISPLKGIKKDHSKILYQWKSDIELVKNYHPLFARSYQLAAYHTYFRSKDKEVFKLKNFDRKDFYDFYDAPINNFPAYIILHSDDLPPESFNEKYKLDVIQSLPSGLVLYEIKSRLK